jgi:hypothetical protein
LLLFFAKSKMQEDEYHTATIDEESMDDYGYNYVGNDTMSDTTFASTANKKNRKLLEDMKSIDKGYRKLPIHVNGLKKNIEVYATSTAPGANIRDAITGYKNQNSRVGSSDEYHFFKVGYSGLNCGPEKLVLFFDSPEQYERHMHTTIDAATKSKWLEKCMEIRKRNKTQD